jgi:hypothetical protein
MEIIYKPGKEHLNADSLLRFPTSNDPAPRISIFKILLSFKRKDIVSRSFTLRSRIESCLLEDIA